MTALVARPAQGKSEIGAALDLRRRVFCEEQGVSPMAERDGRDDDALHLVAVTDDALVGTCRLIIAAGTATLSRMAVDETARGCGVGLAVIREAERQARAAGATRISLHAQLSAQEFYARRGFVPRGGVFVEEGIDHVAMEKRIA